MGLLDFLVVWLLYCWIFERKGGVSGWMGLSRLDFVCEFFDALVPTLWPRADAMGDFNIVSI